MSELKTQFGKVAVLLGGWSAERDVSLKSGQAVHAALLSAGIDAHAIDFNKIETDQLKGYDRVFNILHGRGGEDGVVQGLLEYLEIPYTGSGVLGSALAMDKIRTKQIWSSLGLPTPGFRVVTSLDESYDAIAAMGLPVIVKPSLEGSSIGITKVESQDQMAHAFEVAIACKSDVLIEKWIEGNEYTASILGNRVLPMICLRTPNTFYDYEAKYQSDSTEYLCPCGLSEDKEAQIAQIALRAFESVGASGWGRIDFMLDENEQPWLIEANTVPGMTDHSLVPMAAKQAGITFEQLVVEILKTSLEPNV